ncbi:Sequence-specific DNA binding [Sparganum proliferum]
MLLQDAVAQFQLISFIPSHRKTASDYELSLDTDKVRTLEVTSGSPTSSLHEEAELDGGRKDLQRRLFTIAVFSLRHGHFDQVYAILAENTFDEEFHAELQKLWYQAHYADFEFSRGRKLGAVDKYRIRRKHPLPKTIWDGEKTVYCFKERTRRTLNTSFARNRYPSPEEKQVLAAETGLTMTQV